MIKKIYKYLEKKKNIRKFVINNKHNAVQLCSSYPVENISIGLQSYGKLNILPYNKLGKIKIGHYCSIADRVEFLMGGEHNYKRISTWPFQSKIYKQSTLDAPNYDIVVEDDVWIGYGCLIMSGAHIGKGSVIGARSIVTGEVPPYSIYVGNKVIKRRFSEDIIEKVSKVDFSKIEHSMNDSYGLLCQQEVTKDNVEEIIRSFDA